VIVLEVGDDQAGAIAILVATSGFADVIVTRDLGGRERVVEGRRAP
jgi:methylase of polypeptide subunit release factors